ncbi:MAG: CxxC-x17-CxxC domain-containing protein [Patescibacteria group bacterium]|nr:CxxC-x17-CxxC domain-containing protein [Patescibacteria group bacterium]
MNNFNRGNRPGGRRDFDGGRPTMHQAVCDKCGASCEVPFRPSGDKPIFCNNCFDRKGGRDDRPRRPDNDQQLKEQLDNINAKLDKILASMTVAPPPKKVIKKKKSKA